MTCHAYEWWILEKAGLLASRTCSGMAEMSVPECKFSGEAPRVVT